jgi:hypothetical protein
MKKNSNISKKDKLSQKKRSKEFKGKKLNHPND